jgi:hypothetical protein
MIAPESGQIVFYELLKNLRRYYESHMRFVSTISGRGCDALRGNILNFEAICDIVKGLRFGRFWRYFN